MESLQLPRITIASFNVLAPCYKRVHDGHHVEYREALNASLWRPRLDAILSHIHSLSPPPDALLLQEVWFDESYLSILRSSLLPLYEIAHAQHPAPKPDGLLTLIRRASLLSFHPILTPRTIQLPHDAARTALAVPLCVEREEEDGDVVWLYNVHVSFPHGTTCTQRRDEEATQIANDAASNGVTAIVVGDFNADCQSAVGNTFSHNGFIECHNVVNGHDTYPVTHRNHRHECVFVDHVFLRNQPQQQQQQQQIEEEEEQMMELEQLDASPTTTAPATPTSPPLLLHHHHHKHFEEEEEEEHFQTQPSSPSSAHSFHIDDFPHAQTLPRNVHDAHKDLATSGTLVLRPVAAHVHPVDVDAVQWPSSFTCSDHRPVSVQLEISRV